jgi:hypothetical protein
MSILCKCTTSYPFMNLCKNSIHNCICNIIIDKDKDITKIHICKSEKHKCICNNYNIIDNYKYCKSDEHNCICYDMKEIDKITNCKSSDHICVCEKIKDINESNIKLCKSREHNCICNINKSLCKTVLHKCICRINTDECMSYSGLHYCICRYDPLKCKNKDNHVCSCNIEILYDVSSSITDELNKSIKSIKSKCKSLTYHTCVCKIDHTKCRYIGIDDAKYHDKYFLDVIKDHVCIYNTNITINNCKCKKCKKSKSTKHVTFK